MHELAQHYASVALQTGWPQAVAVITGTSVVHHSLLELPRSLIRFRIS